MGIDQDLSTLGCRLCGSQDVNIISENMALATPVPYPLEGDMVLSSCKSCQFVGAETSSVAVDYEDYYREYNKHQTREGPLADLDLEYFKKIIDLVQRVSPGIFDGARVLDFGSGAKQFSEISLSQGASSASNFDLQEELSGDTFEIIVSTHCFEHIYDFNSEIRRIWSVLADGGVFCIAVPDIRGYSDYYYGPYNCFDLEHINHFDCDSLNEALERNGFTALVISESERFVTETLVYPEIVIVAKKKTDTQRTAVYQSIRKPIRAVMESYMQRSSEDISFTLSRATQVFEDHQRIGVKAVYGIYGLSSYAFRLLTLWDITGIPLSWLADTDKRLASKKIHDIEIYDLSGFERDVNRQASLGVRHVCFIAAVNAHRIEKFLLDLGMESLEVHVLPPDCQNRR